MEFFASFDEFYNMAKKQGGKKNSPDEKFEICHSIITINQT